MTSIERGDGRNATVRGRHHGPVRDVVDFEEMPPSEAICRAIAEAKGTDPTAIGPLYETVDLEAADALLTGDDVELSFTYDGLSVVVRGDGTLVVDPIRD